MVVVVANRTKDFLKGLAKGYLGSDYNNNKEAVTIASVFAANIPYCKYHRGREREARRLGCAVRGSQTMSHNNISDHASYYWTGVIRTPAEVIKTRQQVSGGGVTSNGKALEGRQGAFAATTS